MVPMKNDFRTLTAEEKATYEELERHRAATVEQAMNVLQAGGVLLDRRGAPTPGVEGLTHFAHLAKVRDLGVAIMKYGPKRSHKIAAGVAEKRVLAHALLVESHLR